MNSAETLIPVRETWSKKIDFLFSIVGFSVGLGNVWRFPYLCYNNGGGAFLVPYFISVLAGGIPLFILEVSVGQFMKRGGIEAWNIAPILKGVGYASVIILFYINAYYNVILAWILYYIYNSFTTELPWANCQHEWNSERCFVGTALKNDSTNFSLAGKIDPAEEFWERKVLGISNGILDVNKLQFHLVVCLFLTWLMVYMAIWKGIKVIGKVMYFTTTLPYFFMIVLLIRTSLLPGSGQGVKYYLAPKLEAILDPKVWCDAGSQVFFSYAISIGTLTGLGSYNDFHHNSIRDSVIFAIVNSGTSLFGGFAIFMTLGFMSFTQGIPISAVASSGPGLIFIVYPKALAQMPLAPIWSVAFFSMLFFLGMSSQIMGVEGFVTAMLDLFPKVRTFKFGREIFVMIPCIVSFLFGFSMITDAGMYFFSILDYFSSSRIVLIVAALECVAIAYCYGINRWANTLQRMHRINFGYIPHFFWAVISPIFCIIIFILSTITYSTLTYKRVTQDEVYTFPQWSIVMGWCIACSSVVMIPVLFFMNFFRKSGSALERIKALCEPEINEREYDDVVNEEKTKFTLEG